MNRVAPLVLLLAVAATGAGASWTPPAFCHGIPCPQFTVLSSNTTENLELREYPSAWWASTNVTGMDYDKAVDVAFMRLFKYISGANAAGSKVEMAAPVLTDVYPGAGPACNSTLRISFFTPYPLQGKAPAPTSPDVYLYQRPAQKVAVRQFGGFVKWADYVQEFQKLGASLNQSGIAFNSKISITAGYSSPFTIFNRHQETWLLLE